MASSIKFPWIAALLALMLFPAVLLHAQDADMAGFLLDTSGLLPKFFQRLVWEGDEYALNYEVVIQRRSIIGDEYMDFLTETTKEEFLSVSLPPGKYRYCVTIVDLLGIRGESSQWRQFEVLTAFQPVIEKFYPPSFLLDKNIDRILDISGNNLSKESEIYLRSGNIRLFPLDVQIINDKRIKLIFDDKTLVTGNYEIYVKNPGGLETTKPDFSVKYKKPLDLFFKSFWTPVIPVYGEICESSNSGFFPVGMGFSFEAISSKRATFNGGFEMTLAGYVVDPLFSVFPDYDDISAFTSGTSTGAAWVSGAFNILFQKQFFNKLMAVTLRVGGAINLMNSYNEEQSEFGMVFSLNAGVSYLIRLHDIFYMDIGVDLDHHFTEEYSGFIKPRLAVGWLF